MIVDINNNLSYKVDLCIHENEIHSAIDTIEELHPGRQPRIKWVTESGLKAAANIIWQVYYQITGDDERDPADNTNYDGCFVIEALVAKHNEEHIKSMKSIGWPPDYQAVLNNLNPEID